MTLIIYSLFHDIPHVLWNHDPGAYSKLEKRYNEIRSFHDHLIVILHYVYHVPSPPLLSPKSVRHLTHLFSMQNGLCSSTEARQPRFI